MKVFVGPDQGEAVDGVIEEGVLDDIGKKLVWKVEDGAGAQGRRLGFGLGGAAEEAPGLVEHGFDGVGNEGVVRHLCTVGKVPCGGLEVVVW